MYRRPESELLVVGAGPVGLFSAIALQHRGVEVRIVDEDWRTSVHSYALALHPHSVELLDELGLSERLIDKGVRVDTIAFYDGPNRRAELRLSELRSSHPFALALPQSDFEDVLENRLKERGTSVNWNCCVPSVDVVDERVVATIGRLGPVLTRGNDLASTRWVIEDTVDTHPHFVIGADGHRSVVRRGLGFEYEAVGPPEVYGVFEFEAPLESRTEVRVVLGEQDTSVLWPLPGGRCRWSFQLPPAEVLQPVEPRTRQGTRLGRHTFRRLGEAQLCDFLTRRAPWFEARPEKVSWAMSVQFERRMTPRFGRDHLWLVGDAAHQTSPVGVQSMNVAIRESNDLAERITDILRDRSSLAALERYNDERRSEWRKLLGFEKGVRAKPGADPWIAANAERLLACVPASGRDLSRLLEQVGLEVV